MYVIKRAVIMHTNESFLLPAIVLSIVLSGFFKTSYAQAPFFSTADPISVEQGSGFIINDFNRDGIPDLLTKYDNIISLRIGDGRGHFTAPRKPQTLACQPASLTAADVNEDGIPDLAMTTKQNDQEMVCIYLGTNAGIFEIAPDSPFKVSTGTSSYKPSLRFADLNEDGKIDLIASNERRNSLQVCIGDGTGKFSFLRDIILDPGRWTYSFELADFDGDQHIDLVTTSGMKVSEQVPGRLFLRRGTGKGTFVEPEQKVWEISADPKLGTVADLNGDDRPDVVLIHGRDKLLTTMTNNGHGGFSGGKQIPLNMTAFTVVPTDLNGDKTVDIIAATVDSRNTPYSSRFEILMGDGHGNFSSDEHAAFRTAPGSYRFSMDDLNKDGKSDLVVSSYGSSQLAILFGH
jgi:hypothetical protein